VKFSMKKAVYNLDTQPEEISIGVCNFIQCQGNSQERNLRCTGNTASFQILIDSRLSLPMGYLELGTIESGPNKVLEFQQPLRRRPSSFPVVLLLGTPPKLDIDMNEITESVMQEVARYEVSMRCL
jgi:hypothetical protein